MSERPGIAQAETTADGSLSLTQKLTTVREWVDTGIAASLDRDPSGFMLGIASVGVLAVLDQVVEVLRGS